MKEAYCYVYDDIWTSMRKVQIEENGAERCIALRDLPSDTRRDAELEQNKGQFDAGLHELTYVWVCVVHGGNFPSRLIERPNRLWILEQKKLNAYVVVDNRRADE